MLPLSVTQKEEIVLGSAGIERISTWETAARSLGRSSVYYKLHKWEATALPYLVGYSRVSHLDTRKTFGYYFLWKTVLATKASYIKLSRCCLPNASHRRRLWKPAIYHTQWNSHLGSEASALLKRFFRQQGNYFS